MITMWFLSLDWTRQYNALTGLNSWVVVSLGRGKYIPHLGEGNIQILSDQMDLLW